MTSSGLEQRVGPALVPKSSPLAHVGGAMNAVLLRGDFVGDLMLEGHGAGGMPTASAVVADIMDIARGARLPVFGVPAAQLAKARTATIATEAGYYMRLQALDKPGVVADISAILRDEAISIASLIQHGTAVAGSVPVVITTHHAPREAMRRVMRKIAALPTIAERPCLMPIED
jgi:homoserine dehydrogenase